MSNQESYKLLEQLKKEHEAMTQALRDIESGIKFAMNFNWYNLRERDRMIRTCLRNTLKSCKNALERS